MAEWLKAPVLKTGSPQKGLGGSNPSPSVLFHTEITREGAPVLVVIDPLSTFMIGDHRASDIAKVNREGFLQIVQQTGAAVLVVVHAGWGMRNGNAAAPRCATSWTQ